MTPDTLEALILEAADGWALQRAFATLDEKARAKLSSSAQKIHSQLNKSKAADNASGRLKAFIANRKGEAWSHWNAAETRRAGLALYALCPLSVLTKRNIFLWQERDIFERILEDRRPEWLDDWVAHTMEDERPQLEFSTLRRWIKAGICTKPEVDGYYRVFAWHLMRTPRHNSGEIVPPLSRQLLEDPDLLADIEGLFRVENIAFNTNSWLTAHAAQDYETWPQALVKLATQEHVDRAQLLNLALQGLRLDLKQNQLSGFHGLYKQLAPTREERLRHQPDYIALLCHPVGHVVKFALEMLSEIDKAGALDVAALLDEIPLVLTADSKGNAVAALKLLGRVAGRKDGQVSRALDAIGEGLRHANADVQGQALSLLETHVRVLNEEQREVLRDLDGFVAASNRPRLMALTGEAAPPPGAGREPAAPEAYAVISDDINAHEVLAAGDRIAPIASVDALIAAALHAVEIVDSPDEVERIIDGISRLAADRPADFAARVAPLEHRLKKAVSEGSNGLRAAHAGVGLAVLDLIYSWVNGKPYVTKDDRHEYYAHEDAFVPMITHLRVVTQRVASGQGYSLLAVPTHKGGWIDPLVWMERLLQAGDGVVETMDFRLSLLRLAPDNRQAARGRVTGLPAALRRIVDFALGGDTRPEQADSKLYAAWISAARCREPFRDWSADFAPLRLADDWPGGLKPADYDWQASHKKERSGEHRWKIPQFTVRVADAVTEAAPSTPVGLVALLVPLLTPGLIGRSKTDWRQLPTAALTRRMGAKHTWSGELNTVWVSQWLAFMWPQNPAATFMKGAKMLAWRMDENSSSWSPGFGYFQALFQPNRPWHKEGHLLLCLGLAGKDADAKGLAVDALIEGISGQLFDPEIFAETITRLAEGEWLKLNRLGDSLMSVVQVSERHAAVVGGAVQKWLPTFAHQQTNAFRILEVLLEAQAVTKGALSMEAREALGTIGGGGKAAKVAKQILNA